jgi:hypothetical protein
MLSPRDLSASDCERTLLSALIQAGIDGDDSVKVKCLEALPVEAFTAGTHRAVYQVIISNGVLLDLLGVWREIENRGFTGQVDKKYLANIADVSTGTAHVDYHIEEVRKAYEAREASKSGHGIPIGSVASRVREYLLEEFDGGVFKLSELRRELRLDDAEYALARQCVRRMVKQQLVEKHGHQLACYRVVDRKKTCIDWNEAQAEASKLIGPGHLHKIVIIRAGDMVAFAGHKNMGKTSVANEFVRLNLPNFMIHYFITEYKARMKKRLQDFGIDLNHPNLHCYQIEKSDYIPDKIEGGVGVLNIIDHYPNLDNFYLVGKHQDEIHRNLNGAICVITHQKKKPEDLDAIGGSFWMGTPSLAVTLFWDKDREFRGKMLIRKGKEPAPDRFYAEGLELQYNLINGCKFEYDPKGWK